uniref:Transmembrane protein n=1 Tax=Arundo donax TaxID=35708 RepID=A0A0A9BJ59_ARUDO
MPTSRVRISVLQPSNRNRSPVSYVLLSRVLLFVFLSFVVFHSSNNSFFLTFLNTLKLTNL